MGQEYFINSQELEDKIRTLLPSQGGAGAGFDLSASTQIIPIIDLTESAEGSNLRQDLQSSFDINVTPFDITNATGTVIINTTGYWRFYGNLSNTDVGSGVRPSLQITDGSTTKILVNTGALTVASSVGVFPVTNFDIIVKINAGESVTGSAGGTSVRLLGVAKQIASIDGVLT
tara:strand:+ start:1248 stop:1769 length:522 start_codon:yes stop_codon:yes gene_type:complete